MRYSLKSRFSGTILGAFLGRNLPLIAKKQHQESETLKTTSLQWLEIATLGVASLIKSGRFSLKDWQKHNNREFLIIDTSDIGTETITATLPVALFFHENTIKLRENLLLLVELWHDDPLVRDGTLAVGYAIAQSLTEKLSKSSLISQTISFIGESSTSLPKQLIKVNHLLESQAGLERVQTELNKEAKLSNAIAMAFYCFLDTLEDFRLSVLRSTQIQDNSHGINTITGALSGAYNSTTGIPVNWQVLMAQANSSEQELMYLSRLLKFTDVLVSVWSGIYDFGANSSDNQKGDCTIAEASSFPFVEHISQGTCRPGVNLLGEILVAPPGVIR